MKYFCGHMESFYYAYHFGREAFDNAQVPSVPNLDDCVSKLSDVRRIDLQGARIEAPPPLAPGCLCNTGPGVGCHHVLVAGNVNRHHNKNVIRHRWCGPLPPNAFRLLGNGIYVSTPEFTFLQLARSLTPAQLALVGCSLCSSYRLDGEGRIEQRVPVSSIERLSTFLESAKGAYGVKAARSALDLVAEGAESPTELDMYCLVCLPRELGGQGAPKAELNTIVPVEPNDTCILDRPNRASWRIDMCWPELGKGIEYLGKQHDSTPREDRERMNSLVAKGYSILQFDYGHLVDPIGRDRRVAQINRLLWGPSASAWIPTAAEVRAQESLERDLFGPARFRL